MSVYPQWKIIIIPKSSKSIAVWLFVSHFLSLHQSFALLGCVRVLGRHACVQCWFLPVWHSNSHKSDPIKIYVKRSRVFTTLRLHSIVSKIIRAYRLIFHRHIYGSRLLLRAIAWDEWQQTKMSENIIMVSWSKCPKTIAKCFGKLFQISLILGRFEGSFSFDAILSLPKQRVYTFIGYWLVFIEAKLNGSIIMKCLLCLKRRPKQTIDIIESACTIYRVLSY